LEHSSAVFSLIEVVEALSPLAQPQLLVTQEQSKSLILPREQVVKTDTLIAPVSKIV
jgi:hypothetical protein